MSELTELENEITITYAPRTAARAATPGELNTELHSMRAQVAELTRLLEAEQTAHAQDVEGLTRQLQAEKKAHARDIEELTISLQVASETIGALIRDPHPRHA